MLEEGVECMEEEEVKEEVEVKAMVTGKEEEEEKK